MELTVKGLITPIVCFIICSIILFLELRNNHKDNLCGYKLIKKSIFPFVCWVVVTILGAIDVALYIVGTLQ